MWYPGLRPLAFAAIFTFLAASASYAMEFDALGDFGCANSSFEVWSYEAYRAEDGSYLSMIFGHVPLTEISKYGIDAFHLPDGDQEGYPFIVKFPEYLLVSPSTRGGRYDFVLTWKAPESGRAVVSGFARLVGDLHGSAEGKTVVVELSHNGGLIWEKTLSGPESAEFELGAQLAPGDLVRLRVKNAGDASGNVTAINMHVGPDG